MSTGAEPWKESQVTKLEYGYMKRETHTVEFKQSWHDEYLKWICGFANAQDGKLIVGMDDSSKPVGVANVL